VFARLFHAVVQFGPVGAGHPLLHTPQGARRVRGTEAS